MSLGTFSQRHSRLCDIVSLYNPFLSVTLGFVILFLCTILYIAKDKLFYANMDGTHTCMYVIYDFHLYLLPLMPNKMNDAYEI